MLNSKGLRKLQNKLGLKKLANNVAYQLRLDPNTGVAVLVDNDGNFIYFPKPLDPNSPELALYLFLVNYNNRLNNPYGTNEEGGIPIVFGADILGSQLLRKYISPGNPLYGNSSVKNDIYSQIVYEPNPDNPINLFNLLKNLAFADAEFRGMHYGSKINPHRRPTSTDFSDIFSPHDLNLVTEAGRLTHLNLSVVDPENTNVITTNPLHNWYASEIEDDLRLRGFPEQLILARPTSNLDTVAGRAAEHPIDSTIGGWRLYYHELWSRLFGDTEFRKTMREIEDLAAFMENENRFTRFVPVHQQAAYRTLRELERQGKLNDPFFVNGNMFYIAPTTVNEDGEAVLIWNPGSSFIDLANRKDLELVNIERALTNEAALTEAINAINSTMHEGSLQPIFSSPEAQLLFTVLDNNRRKFYLLDTPKILEDGSKLLYDVDKMPAAYTSILPYYSEPKNYNINNLGSQSSANPLEAPVNNPLRYRTPSLSDFALFLNENVKDNIDRVFIDSAGRQFITQSNDLPLYRHTSDNLDPTADKEAYDAINGANYGWLNRNYGLYRTYGNPYALLVTGGILESAYLRKRDSDQLLRILSGLGDSDINRGIETIGNRDSTGRTPYLLHHLMYMGFDPSSARVPTDGNLLGLQVYDNPGGKYAVDSIMNSDRAKHVRMSDFSRDWELGAYNAGKWVEQLITETLGGTKTEGAIGGEAVQLLAGIANPQWLPFGAADMPWSWTDGTGVWQKKLDKDLISRLSDGSNAELLLNLDQLQVVSDAYYNPFGLLSGTPQLFIGDVASLPLFTSVLKRIGIPKGINALGRRYNIPFINYTPEAFVAKNPVIKGRGSFILNELSNNGLLEISQSGAGLVYNGRKSLTLRDFDSNNALVENSRGQYMRVADLEMAKINGVDLSPFWKPGEKLTLHASPSEVAAASNGMLPLSFTTNAAANVADLVAAGGTLPNVAYNILNPAKAFRGYMYDSAVRRGRGPLRILGPTRLNTFSYDPKTKTLVNNRPVLGLIGVNGVGGRWSPLNWGLSLIYDANGNIRPGASRVVGRNSYTRLNSHTAPHAQVNVDSRLYSNNKQELEQGELRNTANYYTPSTYNAMIDEYANNDYINRSKLPKDGLTAGTSAWPWLAIGGAGLGLGLLLSNRKKEEEEKRKRKKLMQLRRLQLANYYNEYPY